MDANKNKQTLVKKFDSEAGTSTLVVFGRPPGWNLIQSRSTIRLNLRPFAVQKNRCAVPGNATAMP